MPVRTQLALAVAVVVAVVVAVAGLILVLRADDRDQADLDGTLAARASQVSTTAAKSGKLPTDGAYAVRLIAGDQVRAQAGPSAGFPLPARDGYSTVTAAGRHWRSLSRPLVSGAQLQVLVSLRDVERRHAGNARLVILLVLIAALLGGAGAWFVTGQALRPLQRLRDGVRTLRPEQPGERLAEVSGPPEVAELTAAYNGLLDRLQAQESERVREQDASAAEQLSEGDGEELRESLADLGAGLETLLSDPDMPITQRHLLVAGLADQQRRIVRLLGGSEPA